MSYCSAATDATCPSLVILKRTQRAEVSGMGRAVGEGDCGIYLCPSAGLAAGMLQGATTARRREQYVQYMCMLLCGPDKLED
jgi:hypothetical protein